MPKSLTRRLVFVILAAVFGPMLFLAMGVLAMKVGSTANASCNSAPGVLPTAVPEPMNGIFTRAATSSSKPADPLAMASIYYVENGQNWRVPPPPYGTGPPWRSSGVPASAVWPDGVVGARGGMQFEPGTWLGYQNTNPAHQPGNPDDLTDASYAQAQFVADLGGVAGTPVGDPANVQKGTLAWVFGAYNAGPAGDFSNSQTAPYIRDAVAIYNSLAAGAAPGSPPPINPCAAPPTTNAAGFVWPVFQPGSEVISCYGPRVLNGRNEFHPGLDIGQDFDRPVYAAASGTVMFAGPVRGFGDNYVLVRHPGNLITGYGHMNGMSVTVNQAVTQGQQIGIVGSQGYSFGSHLHFNVIDFNLPNDLINGNVDPLKTGLSIPSGVPNPNGCT